MRGSRIGNYELQNILNLTLMPVITLPFSTVQTVAPGRRAAEGTAMNEEIVRLAKACRKALGRCTAGCEIGKRLTSPRPARCRRLVFGVLLAMVAASAALDAQSNKTGDGELSAYTGAAFGLGTHAAVGGRTGTAFSRYAIGLIDISYMPLGRETMISGPRAAIYRASGLYDFALSFHIQIPVRKRWAPYGILAPGLLYNVYQTAVLTPAAAAFVDRSKTNFEFSTGGGVRYYVKDNWGVRPEVRVFISARNFTRISVGVFYDFDSDWPFRLQGTRKIFRHGLLQR